MRATLNFKGIVVAAVVLLAGGAFAANKGSLDLQHSTNVAGKQLASGSYTVSWDGAGDQVQLKIYRGKNEVASTTAHMVKVDTPAQNNSAVVNSNSDGTYTLSQIRFGGKNFALEIPNDAGAAGAAAGASR